MQNVKLAFRRSKAAVAEPALFLFFDAPAFISQYEESMTSGHLGLSKSRRHLLPSVSTIHRQVKTLNCYIKCHILGPTFCSAWLPFSQWLAYIPTSMMGGGSA
jgi:hypothetical protein